MDQQPSPSPAAGFNRAVHPEPDRLPVLDRGYVRIVAAYGDDVTVANQARASFLKEVEQLAVADQRLIEFLAERDERSPFRPALLLFEIKAPILVARQVFKYRIGSRHSVDSQNLNAVDLAELLGVDEGQGDDGGFGATLYARNEASGRYLPLTECYQDVTWQAAPASKKQGAGAPLDDATQAEWRARLKGHQKEGVRHYQQALDAGICAQQARLFLPYAGLYTTWRWLASLEAVAHFLTQRLAEKAQDEIQAYARAVRDLAIPCFPLSLPRLLRQARRKDPDRLAALERLADAVLASHDPEPALLAFQQIDAHLLDGFGY